MTAALRSLRRFLARAALLATVALAAGACPPPPDRDVADLPAPADARPSAASGAASTDTAQPATDAPRTGLGNAATGGTQTPAAGGGEATGKAEPTDATRPVVYERLRGGVFVPRCPSCGEVQPRGAEACQGCGQAISSWRKETLCTRCTGDAACDRCGDDRVCLACDGDGSCTYCGGTGKTPGRATPCLECGGGGRCTACRGDGHREGVAGDFLPTEGWLPGTCATCTDGSGICPECGSSGKDVAGGTCATCAGTGACPDCDGLGACVWCGADGACVVCDGTGREVRNGAPRGPEERVRRMRTSAGSVLLARVEAAPTSQGIRIVRNDGGKAVTTTLPRNQVGPLSWWLVQRDFGPGWDGRSVPDAVDLAKFRTDLADLAVESGWWPLALRSLGQAMAIDPIQGPALRLRVQDVETKRVEDWVKRAEAAGKSGDRERAAHLLEMVVFKGRGTGVAARADLQLLQLRKDREAALVKLTEAERVRTATDAKQAAERCVVRARMRLDRARKLLEKANGAAVSEPSVDRTMARAELAAWSARRLVQQTVHRAPDVAWSAAPATLVTESRLASLSVLEAWATRAVAGGRFGFGLRLARRALAIDGASETAKRLLAEAESGLARSGVTQGSPPPGKR